MPHIGNDIVDLIREPNGKKSTDSRFLRKILTDTEIEQVRSSCDPDTALWSFWACKEAAYKVLKKQTGDAAFVPRRWSVHFRHPSPVSKHQSAQHFEAQYGDQKPTAFAAGDVAIPEQKNIPFFLFSSLTTVHCLAADCCEALDRVIWRVEVLPEEKDPSAFVRSCLSESLAAILRQDQHHIEIRRVPEKNREFQPPVVYLHGVKTDINVSLSHDGRFVAYAFVT